MSADEQMPTRTVNLDGRTLQGTIHMLLFVSILFGVRQGKGYFGAIRKGRSHLTVRLRRSLDGVQWRLLVMESNK